MPSSMMPIATGYPQMMQNRRAPNPAARQIESLINPEVWCMYDTQWVSANVIPPASSAFNFAQFTSSLGFFNARTIGNAGAALSSMTTSSGYVDFPFKAYGLGVEVNCSHDAVNTGFSAGNAPAMGVSLAFCEAIVYGTALTLQFATDYKLIIPTSDIPAGGGLAQQMLIDTRALNTTQVASSASNGLASVQSRVLWKDYILFRGKDTPFTVNLVLSPDTLKRVNNLPALTSPVANCPSSAMIRVKFWGYRGKSLIVGSPYRG